MNLAAAILWLTALFLPHAMPQMTWYANAAGGSITFGASIGCQNGSTTTTVATNGSGCTTGATLNLPSGALEWAAAYFQNASSGQTIAFTDTAGNSINNCGTLLFNSAAGSLQLCYAKNTTANSANAVTATISSTVGGSALSGIVAGYITGASTTSPGDVVDGGNNTDGGVSGTAIASATFNTINNTEFVLHCSATSVQGTAPSAGTIGGLAATLTAHSGTGASLNPILFCQYLITATTLSSQTGNITATSSTRWSTRISSYHP